MGFLGKIRQSQKRNGKDWILALVSLLLALGVWLIHNLGLNYIDFMTIPVVAECNIEGHSRASSGPALVTARCKATGYSFIDSRRIARHHVRKIEIDRSAMHSAGGDSFYMTAKDLQDYSHLIFGDKAAIEYYITDTAFFRFPYENSVKVAVEMPSVITCRPQYMVRRVKLDPDSVVVYGEPARLSALEYAQTKPVKYSDLSSSVTGTTKIPSVKGLRYSEETVRYEVEVVRYVESKATLPIARHNVPQDRTLLIVPSEAELTVRSEFPVASDPLEGVTLYIDYREFLRSRDGDCLIHVSGLGDQVIEYSVSPEICEGVSGL